MTNLTGTYNLDPAHSTIGFTVRHAMVTKVRGEFTDFDAVLGGDDFAVGGVDADFARQRQQFQCFLERDRRRFHRREQGGGGGL